MLMRTPRIYLDTSVIGGCCDPEFAEWSNGLFKDFELGYYTPVISDVVAAEIALAPAEVIEKFEELLECNPEEVAVLPEADALANSYIGRGILTNNYFQDALHIALATIAEVDFLVSWNFRHVVHVAKVRSFNAVNLDLGYKPLQICSPREVTYYGYQDR